VRTCRQPAGCRVSQFGVLIQVCIFFFFLTGRCLVLTASPRSTSLTLLEGLGALESAIANQLDVDELSRRVPNRVGSEPCIVKT
jgi:hypothetical protein